MYYSLRPVIAFDLKDLPEKLFSNSLRLGFVYKKGDDFIFCKSGSKTIIQEGDKLIQVSSEGELRFMSKDHFNFLYAEQPLG